MTNTARAMTRVAGVIGLALAASLALTACSTDDAGEGPDKLTLQTSWLPSVQFSGSYIADDAGYYEDEDLDVSILPGGPDVANDAVVAAGNADIGLTNADNVARANAEGADLVIVAAGFQKQPFAILSAPDDPLNKPKDLIGKRIGVPSADTALLDTFLELNDIDKSDVTVVPVGFDVAPLVSGEVDGLVAFYTEQPTAYTAATGEKGVTMLVGDYGLDVYAQVYVVRRETLDDPDARDRITRFLKAEKKGWGDVVDDVQHAVDLTVETYAKDGGLSAEQQLAQATLQLDLLTSPDTEKHGLFWISDDGIKRNIATITALGISGADASMFDTSILESLADTK
ncbi:ABC transporter substrate-binding protein [Schumannella soli]|uniref:Thiamine pyrimidine synthase n=1 Tax=Schumannella soli TaxID=2590779 RepID=A0A506Y619_9MICO|nr:ABC transporter substrate-binding protein [Schumannella soli]TPW77462.1 ABC transporter substrate-binding protein [Schumannella soli]